MAHLTFFEKPGCGGNAKQRALLEAAGHTIERRNLLGEPWTRDSLLAFLAPLPVLDWFNRAAPRVKSGEIVPEALAREQALALLLAEPLLIRRPLMLGADGTRMVGFDAQRVHEWIGLSVAPVQGRLEGCSRLTQSGVMSGDRISSSGSTPSLGCSARAPSGA
jgi:nitrogenase-associated protein